MNRRRASKPNEGQLYWVDALHVNDRVDINANPAVRHTAHGVVLRCHRSTRRISKAIETLGLTKDTKAAFQRVRRDLNEYLDAAPEVQVLGEPLDRRSLINTLLYGVYAHVDEKKSIDAAYWEVLITDEVRNDDVISSHRAISALGPPIVPAADSETEFSIDNLIADVMCEF